MATQTGAKPDRFTGLPPGVDVGPLGRRLVAHLIDGVVPAVLLVAITRTREPGVQVGDVVAGVLLLAWWLVVWWMFATRAAGPGMRLMKLQLVGFRDGRPVGWSRFLIRSLVLAAVSATGVGLLVLVLLLLRHPRYQGWHDLAVGSVVIRERMLAPRQGRAAAVTSRAPSAPASAPAPMEVPPATPPVPAPSRSGAPASAERGGQESAEVGDRTELIAASRRGPAAAPPPPGPSWTAILDDGREVPVGGLVLLGRNPRPRPGEESAELVKIADETRTVSKSHLALDVDGETLVVVDRGSTNGSTVTTPDGVTTACEPEQAVPVPEGSVVSMGDHWLTVRQD